MYGMNVGQHTSIQEIFYERIMQKIQELELLEENKRKTLFNLMDTYIRDAKTRQAYATP